MASIVEDYFNDQQSSAQSAAVGWIDASPDDAARSMELSKLTGVPAAAINGDLPTFERQQRARMAGEIVGSNHYIQEYLNRNPLAAQISNDDYGNLDKSSEWARNIPVLSAPKNIVSAAASAFYKGMRPEEPLGAWLAPALEKGEVGRTGAAVWSSIGAPIEVLGRVFEGGLAAIYEGVRQSVLQYGGSENLANSLGREVASWAEFAINDPTHIAPHGHHPLVDAIRVEQNEVGLKHLGEGVTNAQQSLTRERNPDMFADFIRQHNDAKIGISADAVRELYGSKIPEEGDGLLGFIPNLKAKLDALGDIGGDILVPMADWVAKIDPAVAKQLHDFIRIRPGLITADEAVRAKAMVEAHHGSPYVFEAFSMDKIGTGEGAQSYGYGHYFAENPAVAGDYAKRVEPRALIKALENIDKELAKSPEGNRRDELLAEMHDLEAQAKQLGNKYRVRLNVDKEALLDWDKLLQDQPEIINKLANHPVLGDTVIRAGEHIGEDLLHQIAQLLNNTKLGEGQIIERYEGFDKRSKEVSNLLREAGIPGIKYLDQGSRNAKTLPELEQALARSKEALSNFEADRWANDANKQRFLDTYHEEIKDLESQIANYKEPTYNFVIFDDSLITILDRNGIAVNQVRTAAGLEPLTQGARYPYEGAQRGYTYTSADGSLIEVVPTEVMKANEKQLAQIAQETINKILGKDQVNLLPADNIFFGGVSKPVHGLNVSAEGLMPVIAYALDSGRVPQVIRHEAIHQLINWGLITKEELAMLREAAFTKNAEGKDWLDKHDIRERYKDQKLDEEALFEEALAEEFGEWGDAADRLQGQIKEYGKIEKVWSKVHDFFNYLYDRMAEYFGHPPTVEELFTRIESGEVGAREQPVQRTGTKTAEKQPELPYTRRMDDRQLFEQASAIGMTVDQYKRYMKLIEKNRQEDYEKALKRAEVEQKRRVSKEYKHDLAETRKQVAEEIKLRPDVAADSFFRDAMLYDEKIEPRPKLRADTLTPEQAASLPKSYVSERGMHPDDVAPLFGFASGQEMIASMAGLNSLREAAGGRKFEFTRKLVDAEAKKIVDKKYEKAEEEIAREAKEQALSETQLDLLHEELLASGLKAGTELSITKQQVKDWAEEKFRAMDAADIDSDFFIRDAGRAAKEMEDAALRGNWADAFVSKQRQYMAVLFSKMAAELETAREEFTKTAKKLAHPEASKRYEKDFVNWAQDLLVRAGYPVRRSYAELQDSLARSGFTSFDEFVQSKNGDGYELTISPQITDPNFGGDLNSRNATPLNSGTVAEWLDIKDAVDQLAHAGRRAKQIIVGGERMDFEDFKEQVLERIRERPQRTAGKINWLYKFDSEMVRMEEVFKDLDLREEAGPLFSALIRPMIDSKHTEYSMLEDLSKKLTEIKKTGGKEWQKTLNDTIPQDFLIDPWDQTLFDLNRQHMLGIMLNYGNKSNIDKFTRGWGGKEGAAELDANLRRMFDQHATKDDWDYVQAIWDIWKDWREDSADMYYDLSGRQPKWIEAQPIQTPHGEYAGGYYPIIYDRFRSGIDAISEKVSPNALFGPNYFRASPAAHYAKERTGYVDYVQFETSIEQVASRMQQMIHDISYRRAVMDASKIIYDREIRSAITKHYGIEYTDQLSPWLKDIANHFNQDETKVSMSNAVMRRARMNLMGHALGLNLNVILSPSVAKANPADWWRTYTNYGEAEKLAYEKSREIPHTFRNIDRDFRERLEQTIGSNKMSEFQANAVRWGFTPVVKIEQQFRIITFVNEYKKALADGMSEGDAAAHADSLVRERHGASGLPDMPAIMRSSEAHKILTMFYGYFSAMYNWQRQIPGAVRRGDWNNAIGAAWGAVIVPAIFGAMLFNRSKEDDSVFKTWGKALLLQPLSTLVFVRDVANYFIEGNPTRSPLATIATAFQSGISDIKRAHEGKRVEKGVQHTANVIGLTTGLPLAQIGRTSQFIYDVKNNRQHPRNILEWLRGLKTGEARLKK